MLEPMTVRDIQAIQDAVAEYWPDVRWVESTGSTNADLLKDGEPGTVLIADEQTAGKGRLDRQWVSPKGTQLAMSMVVEVGETRRRSGCCLSRRASPSPMSCRRRS